MLFNGDLWPEAKLATAPRCTTSVNGRLVAYELPEIEALGQDDEA